MAEYCLDCWVKLNPGTTAADWEVDDEPDICEGCGDWVPCVICSRGPIERLILKMMDYDKAERDEEERASQGAPRGWRFRRLRRNTTPNP